MQKGVGKRGQLTVAVIVAIIIVGLVLVVIVRPEIGFIPFLSGELNPNSFLRECIAPGVEENIELLGMRGGYENPEGFIVNGGERVKYLCYSSGFLQKCVVQQPLLKNQFEGELERLLDDRLRVCFQNLKEEYERKGYSVSSGSFSSDVRIVPGSVKATFFAPMTVTKDESQTFKEFEVDVRSEIYDLLLLASNIVEFEVAYGDAETSLYLQYYPDLKMEKLKLGDGTTIYTLTNVLTEESFRFASRSLAWPPGYGFT